YTRIRAIRKITQERIMVAGSVSSQASMIFFSVPPRTPEPFAHIDPATPDDNTCVVLTGRPPKSARPIVLIATSSAHAPWLYVRCDLPIFSPTVTTIRFQPTVVPTPSASATPSTTQVGTYSVGPFS